MLIEEHQAKKFRKNIPLDVVILSLALFLMLSGCRRQTRQPEVPAEERMIPVFTSAAVIVPEDFCMLPTVQPYAEENGTISVFSLSQTEEETADGFVRHTSAALTRISPDGEVTMTGPAEFVCEGETAG